MLNKTQIVCTIGPASESKETIKQLILAGMAIARLNLIHGAFIEHEKRIKKIREIASGMGKYIPIAVDLPGPKMRIGKLKNPIELKQDDSFTFTLDKIIGNNKKVSICFDLTSFVKPGDVIYLNDGFIQLRVEHIKSSNIICRVLIGGQLSSYKGLNIPDITFDTNAFTEYDRLCLDFAKKTNVEIVSQSFVEGPHDIATVRRVAKEINYNPIIFAKIERSNAVKYIDSILEVSDGIMIARGDLGIETPIEQIAIIQKYLTQKAKECNKSVVIATQMLESMVNNKRPTRAESTDVANAVFDGADFVMLSEESAAGKYPIEATLMLLKIIGATSFYTTQPKIRSII